MILAKLRAFLKPSRRSITALLPVLSAMFFVITAETAIRGFHYVRFGISFVSGKPVNSTGPATLSPIVVDEKLGWRATENYHFEGTKHSANGAPYFAKVSQDQNGFRLYGDVSSSKPKIFVIGDSFTQAVDVSDDETYYAVVRDMLDANVFAYGAGGYGSLQELMILDKYFDVIRPDLVLWQYSTNDLVNNAPDLETASTINNNGVVRPYWTDGHVSYILPSKEAKGVRLFSLKYCRLCYMVLNRMDRLQVRIHRKSVEMETSEGAPKHQLFVEAYRVTDKIMEMVEKRVGAVPIAAFIVGAGAPYGPEYAEALAEISKQHHIVLLDDIDTSVLTAERVGTMVRAADGSHWNETGHQIAGRAIAADLKNAPRFQRLQAPVN